MKDGEDVGKDKFYRFYVSAETAGNYSCKGKVKNTCEEKEVVGTTTEG